MARCPRHGYTMGLSNWDNTVLIHLPVPIIDHTGGPGHQYVPTDNDHEVEQRKIGI